jgi:energy-converting hydrogenase Eha subunit C
LVEDVRVDAGDLTSRRCGRIVSLRPYSAGVNQAAVRRWRPFWVHQGAEYLLGLVLVASGVQSTTPMFPVFAGALIVVNAAVVTGPLGAFRLVSRPLHRIIDIVVVTAIVVIAAMPFLDIDTASRVTMIVIAAIMAFLWLSTNFDARDDAAARRAARGPGTRYDSETIGRTAGRLVGKANQYARKRRGQE